MVAGLFKSHIHQKRRPRRPLPERIPKANNRLSKIPVHADYVFAGQSYRTGLIVLSISIARLTIKISMVNFVYNFQRLAWLEARTDFNESRPHTSLGFMTPAEFASSAVVNPRQ